MQWLTPWQDDAKMQGSEWLEGTNTPASEWILESDNRRLSLEFERDKTEKCLLDWDRARGCVRLEMFTKAQRLEPGTSFDFYQRWTPRERGVVA
jgi:hypothetical protein